MKNNVKQSLLVGFFLLGTLSIAQAQQTGATEKAIAALEEKWTLSQKTNSPDMTAPLLADKFIGVGTDGKVSNRTQTLTDACTDEKGKPMDLKARWTDTWVKMPNGAWQCVASQGSEIKT